MIALDVAIALAYLHLSCGKETISYCLSNGSVSFHGCKFKYFKKFLFRKKKFVALGQMPDNSVILVDICKVYKLYI